VFGAALVARFLLPHDHAATAKGRSEAAASAAGTVIDDGLVEAEPTPVD
jgi:hypothetical protein